MAWIKQFILFHGKRHPAEMGESEINRFLTDLAVNRKVSASTQNQALSALPFLYQQVLHQPIGWVNPAIRAKRPKRLPVVLARQEVKAVVDLMDGVPKRIAALWYGAGRRLTEGLRLRVKDLDFTTNQMMVREGKGQKDRLTMRPVIVKEPLAAHLLEDGYDIRTAPELLGHKDLNTTMIYTPVLNRGGRGVCSPADRLGRAGACLSD